MEFLPTDLERQDFHMEFLTIDLERQDFHMEFLTNDLGRKNSTWDSYQLTSSVKIST